ncbi:restriction endonuclease subunit S [Streptococcus suis]|nr:restriction endonuclease subunit S [Streptococcus suis]
MTKVNRSVPKRRFKEFENAGDWEERKVEELCSISTGKSNTQDKIDDGKFPFYVRSPIVERSNRYLYDEEAVLTVGDGVGTGKVYHYVNGKYDLHQRVYRMFNFSKEIVAKYFYYYFSTHFYDRVMAMTAKGSVDSVRYEMISEMSIYIPNIDEQKVISSMIKNFDRLITLHQRKLDKLKNVKKAYLSELFPAEGEHEPKRRFSGFTDPWEQRKLGEMGSTFTGLSGKTASDFGHGEGTYITYMNVFSNPISNPNMIENVEIDLKQNEVEVGDIFFTTSSETPEEVGMSSVLKEKIGTMYLNSFCFGFRPSVQFDLDYLAFMLRSGSVRKQITLLAQGISRFNISKTKMMDINIQVPNIVEQQAIGTFFSNLDRQIALHQRKLDKLKDMKKAYLNELFV